LGGCGEESKLEYTKRLANNGDAKAQYNLGVMYDNGTGVPQDYKEAYVWFSIAKANGYENLDNNLLDNISKEMTKEQITEAQSLSTEMLKRIEANIKN
jgi:TPR repeat protein